MGRLLHFKNNNMPRYPKNSKIIKTNRGKTLIITAHYADKTPEGLWEEVYKVLESFGFFDSFNSI